MIPRTTAFFLSAALLAILLLVAPASAHEERTLEADWEWPSRQRTVDLTTTGSTFTFVSEPTGPGQDVIEGTFRLSDATFSTEFSTTEPGNETLLVLHLAFSALTEFRDADGNGELGPQDQVLRRIDLAGYTGATIQTLPRLAGEPHRVTVVFPINSSSGGGLPVSEGEALDTGNLVLDFAIPTQPASLQGRTIQPTETAIGIRVEDYPFSENGTHLAFENTVRASSPLSLDSGDAAGAWSGFFKVYYGWDEIVATDGAQRAAHIAFINEPTEAEGPQAAQLVTVFPRGSDLRNTPVVGVSRFAAPDVADEIVDLLRGDWGIYSAGLAVSAVAVVVPMVLRLRKG